MNGRPARPDAYDYESGIGSGETKFHPGSNIVNKSIGRSLAEDKMLMSRRDPFRSSEDEPQMNMGRKKFTQVV